MVSKTLVYGNNVILRGSWAFPDSSVSKESSCNARDPGSIPGLGRPAGEGIGYPTPVFLGFPCGSAGKESACNAGDLGLMPGLGAPREGKGYPLQYSGLENSTDCIVHGITKSWTQLSDFTFTFHFSCIREGNGNPLQCSCLENPRDGRAWWAAVYGVAQSRTRLK